MGYDSWATNVYNTIAREAAERKAVTDANRVTSNTQQSVSFIQYNNPRFGLTIQYPSNWEKIDVENGVSFLSPLDNPMDKYREGVSVQVFNHQGFSLEQYVQAIVNDLSQKTQLYGTNSNPSNLAGYPAIEFHCMFYSQNIPCEMKTLFSIINGKLYLVEYHAYDYARFLPIADRIISTFGVF